jgi:pyruvate dehydrogenase E2 component (dihydrolipoamide acetyltransferase)
MSEPITMPTLSDTMNSGRLVKWVKHLGDAIKKGETIAEVETDKAVMEVPAFHDGYLAGPLAPEGTEMPVGKTIGYIADSPGETGATAAQSVPAAPKSASQGNGSAAVVSEDKRKEPKASATTAPISAPAPTAKPAVAAAIITHQESPPPVAKPTPVLAKSTDATASAVDDVPKMGAGAARKAAASPQSRSVQQDEGTPSASPAAQDSSAHPAEMSAAKAPAEGAQNSHSNRISSSPLARRLAEESGVDLARLEGSGPHGRVVAADVEAAKSGRGVALQAAAEGGVATSAAGAGAEAPAVHGMSDKQILALYPEGSYEVVPHDGMRRIIAQRLVQSNLTIPHFYLTVDCDIGRLVAAREEINSAAPEDKDGKPFWKLSVNDFVIKALALSLQRVPDANATWTEAGMLKHKHSDIGVAVAIKGGLITPLLRKAEAKSLSAISKEMKELADRARARKLKLEEYQGGTTAVSNLGMFGIKDFTAVINPPQATILAVGAGGERPVACSGKIEIATIMTVTLSCDHRVVDGALGAQLIGAFKELIEHPMMMTV